MSASEAVGRTMRRNPDVVPSSSPPSTRIVLSGIDLVELSRAVYGERQTTARHPPSAPSLPHAPPPEPSGAEMGLTRLCKEGCRGYTRFSSSSRFPLKCWVNMYDYVTGSAVPAVTSIPCGWCRAPIPRGTRPVGCPMRYTNPSTPKARRRVREQLQRSNLPTDTLDFFETEGVFCSFNCVRAFIDSMVGNPRYRECAMLLDMLYEKMYGTRTQIRPAPPWRTLDLHGGHLTPEEYRASTEWLAFRDTSNMRRSFMHPMAYYVQEIRNVERPPTGPPGRAGSRPLPSIPKRRPR